MRLNDDLIRDLLIYIEENGDGKNKIHNINIAGFTENEIDYHIALLFEEGYILAHSMPISGKIERSIIPIRLTMTGHSYLENIRNKYIWQEIKRDMEIKGLKSTSLDIIKDFANKFIRKKLDL